MKARIVVNGTVQMVGYRAYTKFMGRLTKLKGTVRNLDDGSVEIYAEGDENVLKKFYEEITDEKDIEGLQITEKRFIEEGKEEYKTGREPKEFKFMDVDYGRETTETEREQLERSELAIVYFNKMRLENKDFHKETVGEFNKMRTENKHFHKETVGEFGKLGNKLDGFSGSTSERFDTMEQKYGKVSESLETISKDLHELVEILKAFKPKE